MKNFYLFLSGLVAIAFTACTNDDFLPEIAKKKIIVTAYAAGSNSDAATRIEQNKTDDSSPIALTWSDDDAFSATRGGAFETFTKKADVENEFEGNEPTGNAEKFFAVYPAIAAETQATHTAVPFDISNQTGAFPYLMHAASSDGLTYQFHHAVAYLKVTFPEALKNQTVTITITTPEGVYTGGSINLENGTLSGETGDKNTITKQVTFGESTETWFALPPMAAENKVLSFSVETNSAIHTATLAGDNAKPIRAGHYYNATIASWAATTPFCVLPDGRTFKYSFLPAETDIIKSVVFEANSTKTGGEQIGESTAFYILDRENWVVTVYTDAPEFILNADCSYMFYEFYSVTSITFGDCINTANVNDMSNMFNKCNALSELDLSSFNTANVNDMSNMFDKCKALTELNLSSFNTEKVVAMREMFNGCKALTELDLSSFTFNSSVNLSDMFRGLGSVANDGTTVLVKDEDTKTYLESKSLGTGNYTITVPAPCVLPDGYTFNGPFGPSEKGSVKSIVFEANSTKTGGTQIGESTAYYALEGGVLTVYTDAPEFVFNADCAGMFADFSSVISITFGDCINTANVTYMGSMFSDCGSLASLDLSNFNTANVEYIDYMFYGCSKLTELDLSSFTFKNNVSLYYMFDYLGKETNDGTTVLVKDEATKTYLEGKKDSLGYGKYTITVPAP